MAEQDEWVTIDELAHRTGLTTRNIRAYTWRGLLPAPEVRARKGYYGPEHVARLELIREMQAEGFNLKAIKRLLDASPGATGEMLGFKRALLAPFGDEDPEVIDARELAERFGGGDQRLIRKAEKLGVIVSLGDERYEVPSPRLLRAGEEVIALGATLEAALAVMEDIDRHAKAVADAFVKLFMDQILAPLERTTPRAELWPKARQALERLRPLASDALLASFHIRMTKAAEAAFGQRLER